MAQIFTDRIEAGRLLADQVAALQLPSPAVLALPRGGVPVAAEVAWRLQAPLDLLIVRKIGLPWHPELAVAALVDADPPVLVTDEQIMALTNTSRAHVEARAQVEALEIARRRELYLQGRQPVALQRRSVILVDDGIATGTTVRAALKALRERQPAALVLAVPVAAPSTAEALRPEVDELVCLLQPPEFQAVGAYYRDFHQVSDEEVIAVLRQTAGI
ncbi:phosphoribosyltransferase family protein [Aquabacterium sp. A7-Y]|uniref:phosphoribosyltransferase n=1 Tax=Aquabacterium sp. A7-Y TaxID=1349605 RepID=UPI00223CCB82|nr:phosphoribosyltransferase family protein [Aquabacterium sp. A7-Y]MCW7539796.1 phosphoribosyltransferase family protein [Aquabacterium sp. A7-Y]